MHETSPINISSLIKPNHKGGPAQVNSKHSAKSRSIYYFMVKFAMKKTETANVKERDDR